MINFTTKSAIIIFASIKLLSKKTMFSQVAWLSFIIPHNYKKKEKKKTMFTTMKPHPKKRAFKLKLIQWHSLFTFINVLLVPSSISYQSATYVMYILVNERSNYFLLIRSIIYNFSNGMCCLRFDFCFRNWKNIITQKMRLRSRIYAFL